MCFEFKNLHSRIFKVKTNPPCLQLIDGKTNESLKRTLQDTYTRDTAENILKNHKRNKDLQLNQVKEETKEKKGGY